MLACDQLVSKVREWHFICSINFMLRTNKQNQVFLEALASLEPTMAVCLCVCMSVSVSQLASRSQYIIQMKSDLYETFRTALHCGLSRWSRTSKMDDPILQDSSQEPSASFKYDFEDGGFLTHFYSCKRAEIRQTSQKSHILTIHDIKNDPIIQVSSQKPSTSSK